MLNPLDYQSLAVGETQQGTCPTCGKSKSFYVTRKTANSLAFICFRASCPTQGYLGASFNPSSDKVTGKNSAAPGVYKQKRPQYTGKFHVPKEDDIQFFNDAFGIDVGDNVWKWIGTTDDHRYVFPYWGPDQFEKRGVVLRVPQWSGLERTNIEYEESLAPLESPLLRRHRASNQNHPKSQTFLFPEATNRLAWYVNPKSRYIFVVEDQLSAMRIWTEGHTAVALLGTHVGQNEILDILRGIRMIREDGGFEQTVDDREPEVVFAFDPDATSKALSACLIWGSSLPRCRAARLQHDPKDYPSSWHLLNDLGVTR